MQALAHPREERRTGRDRRVRDRAYRGADRRKGIDRRAAGSGRSNQRSALTGGHSTAAAAARPPVAHRLGPVNGHPYLSPLVIVMRIAAEFGYIDADEKAGLDCVEDIICQIEARNRRNKDPLLAERMEQLEKVKDRAVHVCFGDNPGCDKSYLCAVVIPGEPLIFEYDSPEHEEAVQPLLERCAKVLGYGVGKGIAGDLAANLFPPSNPRHGRY